MMWPEARDGRALEDVLLLERQLARQEPFASLGHYLHLLARSSTLDSDKAVTSTAF